MFEKPIINNIIGRSWAKYRDLSVASRSIICWSRRLRKIIDLPDTDKSRYFAITKLYQSITELVFTMNICGKQSNLPFSRKSNHKKEKARFPLCTSGILVAAKHSWTALRMSRPLFVGSYLQVTWWALGQWKERKNLLQMILHCYSFRIFSVSDWLQYQADSS